MSTSDGKARTFPTGTTRRRLWILLGLALSLVFLYLSFRDVDAAGLVAALRSVSVPLLLVSLIVRGSAFLFTGVRTHLLVSPIAGLSPLRGIKSVFLAFAGNNLLPLRIGELLRIHYVARHASISHTTSFAIVGTERLIELIFALVCALSVIPMLLVYDVQWSLTLMAAAVVSLFATLITAGRFPQAFAHALAWPARLFSPVLHKFVSAKALLFAQGLAALSSARINLGVFSLTSLQWISILFSLQLWIWAWSLTLPWYASAAIVTFINFGTMLPSSPSFIGPYHYFTILALRNLGVEAATAAAFALVAHALSTIPFTLLALVLLTGDYLRGDLVALRRSPATDATA